MTPGRLRLVAVLALRDLGHERRLFLCSVVGLAAVLAPLIVLFGLRSGVIEGLRADFIQNPRARMVINSAYRTFDATFMARLAARPEVAFVVPRSRTLNAEGRFENPERPGSVEVAELMATAPGDPLLPGLPPLEADAVVPSAALAARLGLQPDRSVVMRVVRGQGPGREVLSVPVRVAAVAPPNAMDRTGAFVSVTLLDFADDFVDDKVSARTTLAEARRDPERVHAGFRAHVAQLEDLVALDLALRTEGVEVETRAAEAAGLLGLDRSLTLLFLILAGLGGAGYLVSLGVGLYAAVERKRRDLSLLRLLGLTRSDLIWLPLLQAAAVALAGAVLAAAVALGAASLVNGLALRAAGDRPVCLIELQHLLVAALVTLVGALAASGFAGALAARVPPAEGLRDE